MAFLKKTIVKGYVQYNRQKNGFVLYTQTGNRLPVHGEVESMAEAGMI